jgi:hypothetical protein
MTRSDEPLFEPRIADWLEGDPYTAPDQALDVVLAAFPSIKQRRAWRVPWRIPNMNGMTRIAVTAAAVMAVAIGGLYVFNRGPGGPGGPTTPTPSPTPLAASSAGTITLTDSGCTWNGSPGSMSMPPLMNLRFRNETDDYGLLLLHWVKPGHTWQEGVDFVAELQRLLATGSDWPPNDISMAVAEYGVAANGDEVLSWATSGIGDGPIEEFRHGGNWQWEPGTYGVICSANTSPTGDILTTFLVGPLQLAAGLPSPTPSSVP